MPGGFQAKFVDSAALELAVVTPRWLVKKVLVADQPAVIGGPKKTLKTSLVIDLAVSLATGSPFLSKFEVPRPVKLPVLSGESGQAALLDTARRVCQARHVEFRSTGILWGFDLPRLGTAGDLGTLTTALAERCVEAAIIDPLYLCLLAGNAQGLQASNMFDTGPLLLAAARACLAVGTTPLFVHHARKQSQAYKAREGDPLDLEDLAYAGVAEFAAAVAIGFPPREVRHRGGGAQALAQRRRQRRHSGLYGLDVREGVMDEGFGGRQWRVTVQPASSVIRASARAKEEQKQQAKDRKRADEQKKVLEALELFTVGKTIPDIAEAAGLSKDRARTILHDLLHLTVVQTRVRKSFGTGMKAQVGWMKWRQQHRAFSEEQYSQLRNGETVEDVLGVEGQVDAWGRPLRDEDGLVGPAGGETTDQPEQSEGEGG